MKIVHWIAYREKSISGLHSFATSLYLKMLQMGYDTVLASTNMRDGGEVKLGKYGIHKVIPWSEVEGDDHINILHTDKPPCLKRLRNTVFPTHGSPFYVFMDDYIKADGSTAIIAELIDRCDLVISWNKKYIQYWVELTDNPGKIKYVRGGVDVNRFTMEGDHIDFGFHPVVGYCDAIRPGIKQPFNLLFAMKKVAREIDTVKLELFGLPHDKSYYWYYLFGRLKLDTVVDKVVIGMYPEISKFYRGLDLLVHPVSGGTVTSVGAEAMACGCPVIALEGDDEYPAMMKCKDEPDSMAEAIMKLWEAIESDRESIRKKARELAEKYYNIENTVKELVKIFEDFFGFDNGDRTDKNF